jgi:type IV pilus assembly protein PilA
MLQKMKKRLKNQRGMTLVELLAVIVILGIISAIAIPSIGGLINNTKKDAHIANAQQIANAAKLKINSDGTTIDTTGKNILLSTLISEGYLDNIKDPSSDNDYDTDNTSVTIIKNDTKIVYRVKLAASATVSYIDQITIENGKDAFKLEKDDVDLH